MSRYATSCGRGPSAPAQPSRAYPELSALVGPKVPDLRGLFLRGYGSQAYTQNNGTTVGLTATLHTSGALGTVQGDAIRNIPGTINDLASRGASSSSGSFDSINFGAWTLNTDGGYGPNRVIVNFDPSKNVPTSTENRPVNQAVRYLMRART